MPIVRCNCGEEKRIFVSENLSEMINMMEWIVEHLSKHMGIMSATDILTTFTVRTPLIKEGENSEGSNGSRD